MSLSLVLDDPSSLISYGGGPWTTSTSPRWFGGSTQYPRFMHGPPISGQVGTMSMSFQGTSISFWGNTIPNIGDLNVLTASIDGGPFSNTSFTNPSRQTWQQWYRSPTLSDGIHQIVFSHIGQAMDVAIITTNQQGALPGQAAIVDNESSAIAYTGSWKKDTNAVNSDSATLPIMFPIGFSISRSTTVGDSLSFRFTGTSATVWGVSSHRIAGTLKITYSIDGGAPTVKDYSVTSAMSVEDVPNVSFFSQAGLSAGDHTLTLEVTECVGTPFMFDYITYTPSFLTVISPAALPIPPPVLSPSDPSSLTNSTTVTRFLSLGSSTSTVTTVLSPSVSGSGSHSNSKSSSSSSSSSPGSDNSANGGVTNTGTGTPNPSATMAKGPSLGLIIGLICGILALFAILTFFWLRRRRLRSSRTASFLSTKTGGDNDYPLSHADELSRIVVPFVPAEVAASRESLVGWNRSVVNSDTYPSQNGPNSVAVRTTAHQEKAFLAARNQDSSELSDTSSFEMSDQHSWVMRSDTRATAPPAYERHRS